MNSRKVFVSLLILFFSLFALTTTQAVGASVKERMKARIPTINKLKDGGAIGENNQGYLQYRGKKQPEKSTVDDENSDRKKVYSAIAKKQGATVKLVGQRRAKQIAEITKPGHSYQTSDGKWHKK